jgi:hypothetical protein
MWWDSLSFVEKRMPKNLHFLVCQTEAAILAEVELFYQQKPEEDGCEAPEGAEEEEQ